MIPVVVVVFIVVVTVTFTACGILDGTVTLDDCGVTSTLGETRLPSILKKKNNPISSFILLENLKIFEINPETVVTRP